MPSDSNMTTRPFGELIGGMDVPDVDRYVVDDLIPAHVVRPDSVEALSEVMKSASADGLSVVPWGGGTQMGFGNAPSKYDVAVDLTAINDVLQYDPDDMTMSVQAGCRLQDLNEMLGEHRQVLPVDTAFPEHATIGGMTAVGASGPRRLGYGPLRDLIIGMSVMLVDGVLAKAGGQVVKNVTGFDMMRLHHGALGSLGIITSINLKVIPKPQSERTVIATYATLEDADTAAREIVSSQLGVTALVVTSPAATAEATGDHRDLWAIAVRCEAPPSAVVRQAERVVEFVRPNATEVLTEDSTEESVARWNTVHQALDQRGDSPDIAFRLGCAPSKLRTAGEGVGPLLGDSGARMTLDYGSGLCYLRLQRELVKPEGSANLYQSVAGHGDHTTILTAPASFKQGIDVFGGLPPGFSMIEALKSTFDPDHLLNPGRSIGRL